MAMTDRDDDRALDALFTAARQRPPEPSADLLARVLADAGTVQAGLRAPSPAAGPAPRGGGWLGLLGGWAGLGGLVAAGAAGLWIGFTGTGALGTASAGLWGGLLASEAPLDAGGALSLTLALEDDA